MTKKIHVHLVDDLDASEASETLRFEVDGRPYEIDLSSHNAQQFRAEIAPYIRHARRVVSHVRRRGRAGSGPGRPRAGAQAAPLSGVTAGEPAAAPAAAGLAGPGYGEGAVHHADSASDVAAGHTPGPAFGDDGHAPS
ncbi:MAG TPA: histone-like nucleoid-structuring protein Lsr2 [Streptosporangiaceae bacterium]|nr:histone-like nucleoid-structuring protein Lsr2 [Streptosporangiaceae bacterium]